MTDLCDRDFDNPKSSSRNREIILKLQEEAEKNYRAMIERRKAEANVKKITKTDDSPDFLAVSIKKLRNADIFGVKAMQNNPKKTIPPLGMDTYISDNPGVSTDNMPEVGHKSHKPRWLKSAKTLQKELAEQLRLEEIEKVKQVNLHRQRMHAIRDIEFDALSSCSEGLKNGFYQAIIRRSGPVEDHEMREAYRDLLGRLHSNFLGASFLKEIIYEGVAFCEMHHIYDDKVDMSQSKLAGLLNAELTEILVKIATKVKENNEFDARFKIDFLNRIDTEYNVHLDYLEEKYPTQELPNGHSNISEQLADQLIEKIKGKPIQNPRPRPNNSDNPISTIQHSNNIMKTKGPFNDKDLELLKLENKKDIKAVNGLLNKTSLNLNVEENYKDRLKSINIGCLIHTYLNQELSNFFLKNPSMGSYFSEPYLYRGSLEIGNNFRHPDGIIIPTESLKNRIIEKINQNLKKRISKSFYDSLIDEKKNIQYILLDFSENIGIPNLLTKAITYEPNDESLLLIIGTNWKYRWDILNIKEFWSEIPLKNPNQIKVISLRLFELIITNNTFHWNNIVVPRAQRDEFFKNTIKHKIKQDVLLPSTNELEVFLKDKKILKENKTLNDIFGQNIKTNFNELRTQINRMEYNRSRLLYIIESSKYPKTLNDIFNELLNYGSVGLFDKTPLRELLGTMVKEGLMKSSEIHSKDHKYNLLKVYYNNCITPPSDDLELKIQKAVEMYEANIPKNQIINQLSIGSDTLDEVIQNRNLYRNHINRKENYLQKMFGKLIVEHPLFNAIFSSHQLTTYRQIIEYTRNGKNYFETGSRITLKDLSKLLKISTTQVNSHIESVENRLIFIFRETIKTIYEENIDQAISNFLNFIPKARLYPKINQDFKDLIIDKIKSDEYLQSYLELIDKNNYKLSRSNQRPRGLTRVFLSLMIKYGIKDSNKLLEYAINELPELENKLDNRYDAIKRAKKRYEELRHQKNNISIEERIKIALFNIGKVSEEERATITPTELKKRFPELNDINKNTFGNKLSLVRKKSNIIVPIENITKSHKDNQEKLGVFIKKLTEIFKENQCNCMSLIQISKLWTNTLNSNYSKNRFWKTYTKILQKLNPSIIKVENIYRGNKKMRTYILYNYNLQTGNFIQNHHIIEKSGKVYYIDDNYNLHFIEEISFN